jgi:hypothetical protein
MTGRSKCSRTAMPNMRRSSSTLIGAFHLTMPTHHNLKYLHRLPRSISAIVECSHFHVIYFSIISLIPQYSQTPTIHKLTDFIISQTTETHNVHDSAQNTKTQYPRIHKHLDSQHLYKSQFHKSTNKANLDLGIFGFRDLGISGF